MEPLVLFLQSATSFLANIDSEIHVALRSRDFNTFASKFKGVARSAGLTCASVRDFEPSEFMGYRVSVRQLYYPPLCLS